MRRGLIYNINKMKHSSSKPKLVLNNLFKQKTYKKLRIQQEYRAKADVVEPPFFNLQTNTLKTINSSILRKQSINSRKENIQVENKQYRIKTNSCFEKNKNEKNHYSSLNKIISQSEIKLNENDKYSKIIRSVCKNLALNLQQKGGVVLGNNHYRIQFDNLNELTAQLLRKALRQHSRYCFKKNNANITIVKQQSIKPQPNLTISQHISIHNVYKKVRKLSIGPSIININQQFKQLNGERQTIQKMLQTLDKPSEQELKFLLNKFKCLKWEIQKKEERVQLINQKLKILEQDIKRNIVYIQEVEKQANELRDLINKHPDKIFRQQAINYKKQEQQLFDITLLLQKQTPLFLNEFVLQAIFAPYQKFTTTLRAFPAKQIHEKNIYKIPYQHIVNFKNHLDSAFQSTVEALQDIIEKRIEKTKDLISTMRKLFTFTTGKRQYLTEINKKMTITTVQTNKAFTKFQEFLKSLNIDKGVLQNVQELKRLFTNMKNIYQEAQIFY